MSRDMVHRCLGTAPRPDSGMSKSPARRCATASALSRRPRQPAMRWLRIVLLSERSIATVGSPRGEGHAAIQRAIRCERRGVGQPSTQAGRAGGEGAYLEVRGPVASRAVLPTSRASRKLPLTVSSPWHPSGGEVDQHEPRLRLLRHGLLRHGLRRQARRAQPRHPVHVRQDDQCPVAAEDQVDRTRPRPGIDTDALGQFPGRRVDHAQHTMRHRNDAAAVGLDDVRLISARLVVRRRRVLRRGRSRRERRPTPAPPRPEPPRRPPP
jgi:hypothetical protein